MSLGTCRHATRDGLTGQRPTFASDQIDLMLNEAPVGITIHAGRAWMNNEALLAVLGAACAPALEWLILVVPQSYMSSAQHSHIVQQIISLAAASGVDLDLPGVSIVPFGHATPSRAKPHKPSVPSVMMCQGTDEGTTL